MAVTLCKVDGCKVKVAGMGYCKRHYYRYLRYGDPLKTQVATFDNPRLCSIDKCYGEHYAKGLCEHHYTLHRYKSLSDPEMKEKLREKIMNSVKIDHETSCWNWTKGLGGRDGRPSIEGKNGQRVVYEVWFGVIDNPKIHVHHKCRNILCMNPEHLELIHSSDHMKLHNPRRTHCPEGHLLDEDNVYIHPNTGSRTCKICAKAKARNYYRSKKWSLDHV